jgi:hypothetical protein
MGFTVYMKIINSSCIMGMRYDLVYYLGLSVFTLSSLPASELKQYIAQLKNSGPVFRGIN